MPTRINRRHLCRYWKRWKLSSSIWMKWLTKSSIFAKPVAICSRYEGERLGQRQQSPRFSRSPSRSTRDMREKDSDKDNNVLDFREARRDLLAAQIKIDTPQLPTRINRRYTLHKCRLGSDGDIRRVYLRRRRNEPESTKKRRWRRVPAERLGQMRYDGELMSTLRYDESDSDTNIDGDISYLHTNV